MIVGLTHAWLVTLLALFPVMNPVGNLPAFVGLTQGDDPATRHRQAYLTGGWIALLLTLFALAGRPLLHTLGISLPALQIGGGLIVAHAAFGMVTGQGRLTSEEHEHGRAKADVSFSPMAMPLLAGPGALGIVIALASRSRGTPAEAGIVAAGLVMAVVSVLVLRFGDPLVERLGPTGIGALTRIFGFLILAIGVELISHGVLALAPALSR